MPTRFRSFSCALLAALFGFVAPLHAQSGFEVAPLGGYYLPVGTYSSAAIYYTSLPTKPSDLSGFAWGVEGRQWIGKRIGWQVQAAVTSSTIREVITPAGPRGPTSAQVVMTTAQALYDLSPSPGNYGIWVSAGPSVVRHGGDAYSNFGSPVDVGGVLGLGLDVPIRSRLRFAMGVESLLYDLHLHDPSANGNVGGSGAQYDLLFHVGLAWHVR